LIANQQQNFSVNDGYFFTFDYAQDALLQKTDDGNTAFSYPFDVLLTNQIRSSEFDGVFFWSLENPGGVNITIKRWKIDNYICKLQQTFSYTGGGSHTYDCEAFTVAHYHDTLVSGISVSGTLVSLDTYGNTDLMDFSSTTGSGLILHLGPNSNGEEENVEINTAVSGVINLTSGTTYAYDPGDPVNFYTYLWVFNDYDGIDSSTGALYKFDAHSGAYITRYAGGAYKDVGACTFYNVNSFTDYGDVDALCYIKGTNTLFVDVDSPTLSYYGSMVMTNIQSDEATVIPIVDLAMDDQNVYRLQQIPDGGSGAWTQYSYLLSTLDAFVTSISLAAYPAIIAANGVSTATIRAIVRDQFLQPIVGRLVYFSDDDTAGYITASPISTVSNGSAQTYYKSGTSAREVKITAVVEQS
jgi:hypothetical protein